MTRHDEALATYMALHNEACQAIANDYGVNDATISRIARRVWRQEVA